MSALRIVIGIAAALLIAVVIVDFADDGLEKSSTRTMVGGSR